ncbi:hypothetical protein L2E82_17301 [Cichorium intybus]|uniref:Uncharacterized protein n=1 Tax=Cichorium intybus TaxID=13427 RepID=A0ACB9F791_CICIN|nr:hypothetical protein L2E82_17301 [Cichorium intybus]
MSIPCGRTRNFDDTNITEEEEHNDIHSQPVPDPVFSENPHPGLKRRDSLDIEAAKFRGDDHNATESWRVILKLAFQSLGVVYGDLGTSPLYVFSSTFPNGIKHEDDILGVLSIIFYTITLITVIKYVMIVLRANDNGDGGTFALYSKLCRYAKVGLIPTEQAEDREVSNFQLELPNKTNKIASTIKKNMESRKFVKFSLLFTAMLGTSMVIGDGILTPSISVLSAVSGLKKATNTMTEGRIVAVSVVILITLFMVQRFGTDKVGYTFAPIICVWFSLNIGVGVYNFVKFDPSVAKAINPKYIIDYFKRNKKDAWISLGGTVLAITGTEAIHAYGIAVIFAETLTSSFMVVIMLVIWNTNILLVLLYVLVISSTEYVYLSSVLFKFCQGGYLPFLFAVMLMFIMCTWNYVYRAKYNYEINNKVSQEVIRDMIIDTNINRMRGVAIFYSELAHGIPPIFKHYVDIVPALHSVIVFVSIKSLPISKVPPEERFLFRRVKPNELYVFRCVVRYGYADVHNEKESFENILMERLKDSIESDYGVSDEQQGGIMEEDMGTLDRASQAGVVHLVGEHEIISRRESSIGKRFLIDYAYNFMKKNLRQSYNVFEIPHKRMLKVGMTYEL